MKKIRTGLAAALALSLVLAQGLSACGQGAGESGNASGNASGSASANASGSAVSADVSADVPGADLSATTDQEREEIESELNLVNNKDVTWSYDSSSDSWTMSATSAVTDPEVPDHQGVFVNTPGAYVKGIDTDGDGTADVTASSYTDAVNGTLVIDKDAKVTSENGQVYTASTAPVVINTGAMGYNAQKNKAASTSNAKNGYINVACGNRGKHSTAQDASGNSYYTGDSPLCLVDQKNAIRFVKYNILLGNLPGSTDYFVSTGGSGGGAHATMVAATSNNPDFYDYEIEAGAVGVYRNEDGSYDTTVSVDGKEESISDGVWGCIAYSAITPLAEGDMAMAFEYYMDTDYSFNTDFQKELAKQLASEYMDYINNQDLSVEESAVGYDLNGDGDTDDNVALTIEYDEDQYADTNGYGGTYLALYLDKFEDNLTWYLDNLDYADGWTWFDEDGNALSDEEVANMSTDDKAQAFLEGRYTKGTSSGDAMGMPGGPGAGGPPAGGPSGGGSASGDTVTSGMGKAVGTPDAGTTQSSSSGTDSSNYSSFDEMVEAYQQDISSVEAGDKYGNNIVELYNPLNYIGAEGTDGPVWTRIMMGASEGDMSLFDSMNLQIAWLNAGTDAVVQWQWDGHHVPSEILGESFSLYLDEMYGKYVDGALQVSKPAAEPQTQNGDETEESGTDISSWASYQDGKASFSLADAVAYRVAGASKAIPGFDVMDYGQETYEFGSPYKDARHFDKYVLQAFQEDKDALSELFNKE